MRARCRRRAVLVLKKYYPTEDRSAPRPLPSARGAHALHARRLAAGRAERRRLRRADHDHRRRHPHRGRAWRVVDRDGGRRRLRRLLGDVGPGYLSRERAPGGERLHAEVGRTPPPGANAVVIRPAWRMMETCRDTVPTIRPPPASAGHLRVAVSVIGWRATTLGSLSPREMRGRHQEPVESQHLWRERPRHRRALHMRHHRQSAVRCRNGSARFRCRRSGLYPGRQCRRASLGQ